MLVGIIRKRSSLSIWLEARRIWAWFCWEPWMRKAGLHIEPRQSKVGQRWRTVGFWKLFEPLYTPLLKFSKWSFLWWMLEPKPVGAGFPTLWIKESCLLFLFSGLSFFDKNLPLWLWLLHISSSLSLSYYINVISLVSFIELFPLWNLNGKEMFRDWP